MRDSDDKGTRGQSGRARVGSGVRARNHTVIMNSETAGGVRARVGSQFGGTASSSRIGGLEDPSADVDPHWEPPPVSSEMLVKKQPPAFHDESAGDEVAHEESEVQESSEPLMTVPDEYEFEAPEALEERSSPIQQEPIGMDLEDPLGLLSDGPPMEPSMLDSEPALDLEQPAEEEPPRAAPMRVPSMKAMPEAEFRQDPMPQFVHVEEEAMVAHTEQRHEQISWKSVTPLVGFLVSFDHDDNGAYLELRTGRLIVTSQREGSGSCLVIHDESVSPMHAVMRVAAGGSIQILDQLSESGTRIRRFATGEEILLSGEKTELSHGDIIGFGDRSFHVCLVMCGGESR